MLIRFKFLITIQVILLIIKSLLNYLYKTLYKFRYKISNIIIYKNKPSNYKYILINSSTHTLIYQFY